MFGVAGMRASMQKELEREGPIRFTNTFAAWSAFYIAGHVLGGAIPGALLGAAGGLIPAVLQARLSLALALVCVFACLREFGYVRLPMPQLHRQVRRNWMRTLDWNLVALGYGLQLGCGIATRIPSTTTYVTLCFALLSGNWWKGALIMTLFGLVRSWLPVAIGRDVQSPESSMRVAMLFSANQYRMQGLAGVTLLFAGLVLAGRYFWRIG